MNRGKVARVGLEMFKSLSLSDLPSMRRDLAHSLILKFRDQNKESARHNCVLKLFLAT